MNKTLSEFHFFLLVLLIGLSVSCISIRDNYLGPSTNYNPDFHSAKIPSETEKLLKQQKTDSLLQVISEQKRHGRHIPAREINQLFSVFGDQLDNDRYYQYLLQKGSFRQDRLNAEQYLAALELLSSAANYEKSYQKNRKVRRSINQGDSGNNVPVSVLKKSQSYLYSTSVRKTLEEQRVRFETPVIDSLFSLLPRTNALKALHHKVFRHNDRLYSWINSSTYAGSYVLGNAVGMFHEASDRKPKADRLRPFLRPFDLVVLRSPSHLTSKFIPGYFGHAGIWLGNDLTAQLTGKASEKMDPEGKAMVEVLRSGVRISSLEEFADGEIFLVIRPKRLSTKLKKSILTNVRKQLSKEYDFNYDIESPEKIMCTELVYLAYDFIDWQIRYVLQRFTLSPDDLVFTAIKDNQFEFPVFMENETVLRHPSKKFLQSLVGQPGQLTNY